MGYGNTEIFLSAEERVALITSLMGKTVDMIIDRPIGHTHVTKGITLHYTINYGYLPGISGGDGEEQNVYILRVDVPRKTFRPHGLLKNTLTAPFLCRRNSHEIFPFEL